MALFQNMFGKKKDANNIGKDNFVVDETGVAQDLNTFIPPVHTTPQKVMPQMQKPMASINTQPSTNYSDVTKPAGPDSIIKGPETESVSSTKAVEELMEQADTAAKNQVFEQPVMDPEFQKAKEEIEKEGGIELFPGD